MEYCISGGVTLYFYINCKSMDMIYSLTVCHVFSDQKQSFINMYTERNQQATKSIIKKNV